MTDVPNGTTPANDHRYCRGCSQALELCEQLQQRDNVQCCHSCFHPIAANDTRVAELEAELDRLAGPFCEHPPCGGKRAIEHSIGDFAFCSIRHHYFVELVGLKDACGAIREPGIELCLKDRHNAHHTVCAMPIAKHPPAPAIEAWLKERSGR